MPAHKLTEFDPGKTFRMAKFSFATYRRCETCGRAQEKVADQNWGRVVGYRWFPKIGRCPGRHDPNDLAKEIAEKS